MPTLMVPASVAPTAVDFPPSVKRTREDGGALYVTPLTQIELTDEELAYIRRSRKDLGDVLIVVADPGETLAHHLAARVAKDPELKQTLDKADARRAEKMKAREDARAPEPVPTEAELHQAQRAEEKAAARKLMAEGKRPVLESSEAREAEPDARVEALPPSEPAPPIAPPQTEQALQPGEQALPSGFRAYGDQGSEGPPKKRR